MTATAANSLCAFIEDFFLSVSPSFIIIVASRGVNQLNFFTAILHSIFRKVDLMNVQLVFVDYKNLQRIEGSRVHNLLLIDSYESFL